MKKCSTCEETKPYEKFRRNRSRKDGYHNQCKACMKTYNEANREKIRQVNKLWYEANKDKLKPYDPAFRKEYYEANKDKYAKYRKNYRQANKEKYAEWEARRRSIKLKAVPRFLRNCVVERQRIRDVYKLREVLSIATGIEHHVDHMWPLSDGGPHWSGNLQILTAEENLSKHASVCKITKKTIRDSLRIARREYEDHSS